MRTYFCAVEVFEVEEVAHKWLKTLLQAVSDRFYSFKIKNCDFVPF